jgi:hypothetical protein
MASATPPRAHIHCNPHHRISSAVRLRQEMQSLDAGMITLPPFIADYAKARPLQCGAPLDQCRKPPMRSERRPSWGHVDLWRPFAIIAQAPHRPLERDTLRTIPASRRRGAVDGTLAVISLDEDHRVGHRVSGLVSR